MKYILRTRKPSDTKTGKKMLLKLKPKPTPKPENPLKRKKRLV